MKNNLLKAENLRKNFNQVEAVRNLSLEIACGEFLAIIGKSGSGKTTALHLMAGLEKPTSGQIVFENQNIESLSEDALALWRREHIGLVFQAFYLIPTLSALENAAFPLYPAPLSRFQRQQLARERLKQVGLEHRQTHRPGQLSGGEQQRVAIARALINQPRLILADEPTGNLESETGMSIMELLKKLNKEEEVSIVVITHDMEVASVADRVLTMKDGILVAL